MATKALKDVRFAKAADVMNKNVVSIDGNATVADAIRLMRDKQVSQLGGEPKGPRGRLGDYDSQGCG